MDHSHMDHGHMGHGDMDHGGMDMGGDSCSMNMLFNWDTKNLCLIFKWWHIRSTTSLLLSLVAVIAVTAGFEALRSASRSYERAVDIKADSLPRKNQIEVRQRAHVIKAVLYSVQSFYAFMLMLLFMTYNGYVMICMGIGAFLGYLFFGLDIPATKDSSCH